MNDWPGFIRRFRRTHALTQASLAEILGVEQATVSRWERGFHSPDLSMQRRLRDLLRKRPHASDQIVFHRVRCALSAMKIANSEAQNLAASSAAASLHGVPLKVLSTCHYRPYFSELLEWQWSKAIDEGFFDGNIASIQVYNLWKPVNGAEPRYCTSYWTPAILSDGQILLVSDFAEISESAFNATRPDQRFSMVSMDELLS